MASTGTITGAGVNLRSAPDKGSASLAKLDKNTTVQVEEKQGDWYKVTVGGKSGFVFGTFVSVASGGESPADPAKPADPTRPAGSGAPKALGCTFNGTKATGPNGEVFGTKFKLGISNIGKRTITDFIAANAARFAGISQSRLRVMQAVSANEGGLEALNTWDNCFLSFGIFQWTTGQDNGAGELPALLARLKARDAATFARFFGDNGLDVVNVNSTAGVLPTGFFTLGGKKLGDVASKGALRTLDWAYRFWLAGQDDAVAQAEIEHAMARIDIFYGNKIGVRRISDYVTSEYGVALLLDEHVNRPGHVPGTLAKAVTQLGSPDPSGWGDADEGKLLGTYVTLRAGTNMTNSNARAAVIQKAVTNGLASNKRGSFIL